MRNHQALWAALLTCLLASLAAAQAPLEAPPAAPPDSWRAARERMVEETIARSPDGRPPVRNPRVLAAMRATPRHEFVPAPHRYLAYEDQPLPIGHEQTISQPYMVAKMTELLAPKATDRVLEVGTGSGYQAAVLAGLAREVYTIEIIEPLAREAAERFARLGYKNVRARAGDGYAGWPEKAPFDSIIVTAGASQIPPPLLEQLKPGGRLVIPLGDTPWGQELVVVHRGNTPREVRKEVVMPVRFVPLTRQHGQPRK